MKQVNTKCCEIWRLPGQE